MRAQLAATEGYSQKNDSVQFNSRVDRAVKLILSDQRHLNGQRSTPQQPRPRNESAPCCNAEHAVQGETPALVSYKLLLHAMLSCVATRFSPVAKSLIMSDQV